MALNINTPVYLVSVGTTNVSITLNPGDYGKFNTAAVINTGTDPVFLVTASSAAPTAVYPTSSTTANQPGDIFTAGRTVAKINPNDGYISLIRKSGATTADVAISLGADY